MTHSLLARPHECVLPGIDGPAPVARLPRDECCPSSICNIDWCSLICNFIQMLPRGPLWDKAKMTRLAQYTNRNAPVGCMPFDCEDGGCATLVDHSIYTARRLLDVLFDALWPALRESDAFTAYDTLDDWLKRLGWIDCFDCACRDPDMAGLTPIEIIGYDELCEIKVCTSPGFPEDLRCAVKQGIVRALSRAQLGTIRNVENINFIIEPLGARIDPKCWRLLELDPTKCHEDDGTTLALCSVTDENTACSETEIACRPMAMAPGAMPPMNISTLFTQRVSASGGTDPYAFRITSGALPAGLTLDGTTGIVTGTIVAGLPSIIAFTSGEEIIGASVAYAGTGYTYAIIAGALPAGVSLTAAGALTGIPSAAAGTAWSFTLHATGGAGGTLQQIYSGTLYSRSSTTACISITISPGAFPNGAVGQPYVQSVSSAGDPTPYTLEVSHGALPPGLRLAPNGQLADEIENTLPYVLAFTSGKELRGVTLRIPHGAYEYRVTGGRLPTGVSLNPKTGALTGIPAGTDGTPWGFRVTATSGATNIHRSYEGVWRSKGRHVDTVGTCAVIPASRIADFPHYTALGITKSVDLQETDPYGCPTSGSDVDCQPMSLTPSALPALTISAAFSQRVSASGGVAPYVYRVTNGVLPPGLSLDQATGVVSGTIAVGLPSVIAFTSGASLSGASVSVHGSTYTYAVTSGSLPAGVTLASDGSLGGSPSAAAGTAWSFTLGATGGSGGPLSQAYSGTLYAVAPTVNRVGVSDPMSSRMAQETIGLQCAPTMKQFEFWIGPTSDSIPACVKVECPRINDPPPRPDNIGYCAPGEEIRIQSYYEPTSADPAGLPSRIYPAAMAAECIVRSLMPPGSRISLVRRSP